MFWLRAAVPAKSIVASLTSSSPPQCSSPPYPPICWRRAARIARIANRQMRKLTFSRVNTAQKSLRTLCAVATHTPKRRYRANCARNTDIKKNDDQIPFPNEKRNRSVPAAACKMQLHISSDSIFLSFMLRINHVTRTRATAAHLFKRN